MIFFILHNVDLFVISLLFELFIIIVVVVVVVVVVVIVIIIIVIIIIIIIKLVIGDKCVKGLLISKLKCTRKVL